MLDPGELPDGGVPQLGRRAGLPHAQAEHDSGRCPYWGEILNVPSWDFDFRFQCRKHRDVRPNDGFLRQLAELDNNLRKERGQLKK